MAVKARRVTNNKPQLKAIPQERWKGTILDLKGIGHGISGMVFLINERRVLKAGFGSSQSLAEIETERMAYRILEGAKKPSPHVLRCFDTEDPRGLVLERCHETLRRRLKSIPQDTTLCDVEVRIWAKQAAEGLAFIHDHYIIQGDVGCHNMLLGEANILKICDFAGSSVAGSHAVVDYEVWSKSPSIDEPTKQSDLFALGSAIYEMSTKLPPYHGKPWAEITKLYQRGQFPSLNEVGKMANVIANCWSQKYAYATEIVHEIDPQMSLCCGLTRSR